jgi:putative effector of murein hydrolase
MLEQIARVLFWLGAFSSLGMRLNGVLTAILLPLALRLF